MLQANSSVLTVSPPDSGFAPRREFVRDNHVSSTFALLAIAGAGFVRCTSFPPQLVAALKRCFEVHQALRGIREERSLNLIEFNLEQKPWASSKSLESERLFVNILAIILQHGYNFISTIDYGREHDDRVSIAFSKPLVLSSPGTSRSDSPGPSFGPTRVPFAISFPSSTVLRVINPPLNSTPAILQGVRSAWPRGVISEKKIVDRCFEFKLKGYKWFQEDTFAADSLNHILSLLNTLDHHSFTLLTSISLSGSRSRVKDLWIFSGPPQEPSSDTPLNGSNLELTRSLSPMGSRSPLSPVMPTSSTGTNQSADALHIRSSSVPGPVSGPHPFATHMRSTTDPNASHLTRTVTPSNSHSVLRKKTSPRHSGTTPPSTGNSPLSRSSEELNRSPQRRSKLSTIGSVDMTGVGSANQRNFTSKIYDDELRVPSPEQTQGYYAPRRSLTEDRDPIQGQTRIKEYNPNHSTERVKTGDLFYETGPHPDQLHREQISPEEFEDERPTFDDLPPSSPAVSSSDSRDSSKQLTPRDTADLPDDVPHSVYDPAVHEQRVDSTPPILSPNTFRDSAFSSTTNQSYEIPIAWTGGPEGDKWKERITVLPGLPFEHDSPPSDIEEGHDDRRHENASEKYRRSSQRHSTSFHFPGAWQPTPIDERPEDQGGLASPPPEPIPEVERVHMPDRKEVDAARVAEPILSDSPAATRRSEVALYGMVSTQNRKSPVQQHEKHDSGGSPSSPTGGTGGWVLVNVADVPERPDARRRASSEGRLRTSPPQQEVSMSPIAKVIAAADALSPEQEEEPVTSSTFKRLFSNSKSKSRKISVDGRVTKGKAFEQEEKGSRVRRLSLRDGWRKKGSASN